jgi:2-methylisocitrate lyase-like PEP mutase family enzyme
MSSHLFRNLHKGPGLLLLPNAWDAVSARLIESLGARAIATTSAGLAWAHGYADGNSLPQAQLIAAIRDIARVIQAPLTVDVEAGYADDPAAVVRLVARVMELGAVGINIEDGGGSPDLLCRKISAIRDCVASSGAELFINARTDVLLRGIAHGGAATEEIIHRATRYRAAGCDGLFVPGLATADAMAAVSAAIEPTPLNVMAVPGLPSMDTLAKSGVRRLSTGSALAQAAIGRASHLASGFLAGHFGAMFEASIGYEAANGLFAGCAHDS